ncbi:MAG: class IV adenylate cyclase [Candidatus Saccharibacteria bacterium]
MKPEIEVKFLIVNHDEVRAKLKALSAKLENPERLMRRAMLDTPDRKFRTGKSFQRLRVRDEGNKVTLTVKIGRDVDKGYAQEVETVVGSFDTTIELFKSIGFEVYSFQESKRETWKLLDVEVVLDEWPWAAPYIEIEGQTEDLIKEVAIKLGFDWSARIHGSVDEVYMRDYPKMKYGDSIGEISEVRFGDPLPKYLKEKL